MITHRREIVFSQLASVLADSAKVESNLISATTCLVEDLGIDSLKLVELNISLERRFDLQNLSLQKWADEEGQRIDEKRYTVASLLDYIFAALPPE